MPDDAIHDSGQGKETEARVLPDEKILTEMSRYNELQPRSKGARVRFETSDFGSALTPELREAEERMRKQVASSTSSR